MTALEPASSPARKSVPVHAEGPGGAVLTVSTIVAAELVSGDEIIHFAIKPSLWFLPLVSARWLAVAGVLGLLASTQWLPLGYRWYLWQVGVGMAVLRLGWAILEWVSRLYILTDRRVLRIRGVFSVELFECNLTRIQNTYLTLSIGERLTGTGSVSFQTAGGASLASWQIVARPMEVHERLREAIHRAGHRGNHGV